MLFRKSVALVVWIVLATSGVAMADGVRLHNRDSTTYELYVVHGSTAVNTSIQARTVTNICASDCTISIRGTSQTIRAQGGDSLVIHEGQLVRRER